MRASAAVAVSALLVLSLSACTDDRNSDKPSVPYTPPSQPAPTAEPLLAPELEKGFKETLAEGPRRGDHHFGTVQFPKGESWVKLNCVSDSETVKLKLALDTIGDYTLGCFKSRVEKNANQLNLATSRKLRFTIEAGKEARWIVSIQAPKK
ncbi:hypothetical protein [Streptomyces wuyuanensis]|uniref:hypothetical protein n=1 Tax=Streptomyces wuyuanensis TaxID=1196353 RepID=UPI00382161CA